MSAAFLLLIAAVNLYILVNVYRTFQYVKNGGEYVEEDLNLLLAKSGVLARLFRPMFRMIRQSWHMYPLGFLFGLGFDTATEIGVLGISAAGAASGLLQTFQQLGGAIGLAVIVSVYAAGSVPGEFVPGAQAAFLTSATFAALAGLTAAVLVRQRRGVPHDELELEADLEVATAGAAPEAA